MRKQHHKISAHSPFYVGLTPGATVVGTVITTAATFMPQVPRGCTPRFEDATLEALNDPEFGIAALAMEADGKPSDMKLGDLAIALNMSLAAPCDMLQALVPGISRSTTRVELLPQHFKDLGSLLPALKDSCRQQLLAEALAKALAFHNITVECTLREPQDALPEHLL